MYYVYKVISIRIVSLVFITLDLIPTPRKTSRTCFIAFLITLEDSARSQYFDRLPLVDCRMKTLLNKDRNTLFVNAQYMKNISFSVGCFITYSSFSLALF